MKRWLALAKNTAKHVSFKSYTHGKRALHEEAEEKKKKCNEEMYKENSCFG